MKPISIHSLLITSTAALSLTWGAGVHADEMYKHVDEQGRVTYSNTPIKGGKKVALPPLTTVQLPKSTAKTELAPEKGANRKALLEEIAKEEKALEAAKQAAKEGAEKPEVFQHTKSVVGKDGKVSKVTQTGRNVVAYEEKMKQLNENIALHEKNLANLKAELASLNGNREDKK